MAEIEHGVLYDKVTVHEAQTRDGQETVVLRAHYQVSEKASNATSIHLPLKEAVLLYIRLGLLLAEQLEGNHVPAD